MVRWLVIFFFIVKQARMGAFDEQLRPLLPYTSFHEQSEKSHEITEIFKSYFQPKRVCLFRAFEISSEEKIDSVLITDHEKSRSLGYIVYLFTPSMQHRGVYYLPFLHITHLKVQQQLRGNNLGTALFSYVKEKKYPEKIHRIELTAIPTDYTDEKLSPEQAYQRLVHFYTKQGMSLLAAPGNKNRFILEC